MTIKTIATILLLVTVFLNASHAEQTVHDNSRLPEGWTGSEQIAMLVYPGFTALDLVGPQYMFRSLMGAKVQIVAKTLDPVLSDTGLTIMPTATFDQIPSDLTVLFVPGGGNGALEAIQDKELMEFVRDRGARADYVTSVCTGSLIIGAAGLLDGYRATSHWLTLDVLPTFGAVPVEQRVVRDRNRITGAGVTSGLDFGLVMVAELRDKQYAESVQLLSEYAPDPPFNAGRPDSAPKQSVQLLQQMFLEYVRKARQVIKDAREAPTTGHAE